MVKLSKLIVDFTRPAPALDAICVTVRENNSKGGACRTTLSDSTDLEHRTNMSRNISVQRIRDIVWLGSRFFSSSHWRLNKHSKNGEPPSTDSSTTEELFHSSTVENDPVLERKKEWMEYNKTHRDQARHSYRPDVDPRGTSILLFPGQGSQFVGMAKDLVDYPNVNEMFYVAQKILGYDLLNLCLNGPKEELNKTMYCQPAIFVTSLAAVEKLKIENPWAVENCITTAGFSIGEYAALVFAGAMEFNEALEVVKARAVAMQKASEAVPSGMLTVFVQPGARLKYALFAAREYCEKKLNIEKPVCSVANFLFPECKVIAGHDEALDFIVENAAEFGLRRPKRLPVSGAFHTQLMRGAAGPLRKALRRVTISPPIIPVHSNVTSKQHKRSSRAISESLIEQVYEPVKWEQILQVVYARKEGEEFPSTFELGPGKQLSAILKKTNAKAFKSCQSINV